MKADQLIPWRTVLKGWIRATGWLIAIVVLLLAGLPKAVATVEQIPEPITNAVTDALVTWAGFASTGDLAATETVFVVGGPQHRQFANESTTGDVGDTSHPLSFTVREIRLRSLGTERATVWVRVNAERLGFESQVFNWDFDLLRRDGRWKVWTVLPAADPPPDAASAGPTTEPLAPTSSTVVDQPPDTLPLTLENSAAFPTGSEALSQRSRGVRIPALSAWIIVITIVGVTLAGYLAPRLDRRTEK